MSDLSSKEKLPDWLRRWYALKGEPRFREAADEIERLQQELAKSQDAVDYYYALAKRGGSAPEPPAVLEKQRDHWRKQCRDLQGILTGIGECISGHEGHVFNDVYALLEQSRAMKPAGASEPPEPAHSADHLQRFTEWLVKEMPAGTVIGDPLWWARKLLAGACVFADEAPAGIDAAIEDVRGLKLPCDVRIGAGTFMRGVPVGTMLMSLRNHIGYAKEPGYPFTDGYLDRRRAAGTNSVLGIGNDALSGERVAAQGDPLPLCNGQCPVCGWPKGHCNAGCTAGETKESQS